MFHTNSHDILSSCISYQVRVNVQLHTLILLKGYDEHKYDIRGTGIYLESATKFIIDNRS